VVELDDVDAFLTQEAEEAALDVAATEGRTVRRLDKPAGQLVGRRA
jgi:hypothetical protein